MDGQERSVSLGSAWEAARARLQADKKRIDEEIRTYPRPIAACDVQFNYLLEERARMASELDRMLEDAQKHSATQPSTSSSGAKLGQPGQR